MACHTASYFGKEQILTFPWGKMISWKLILIIMSGMKVYVCSNTWSGCYVEFNQMLLYGFFKLIKKLFDPKLNGNLLITILLATVGESNKDYDCGSLREEKAM